MRLMPRCSIGCGLDGEFHFLISILDDGGGGHDRHVLAQVGEGERKKFLSRLMSLKTSLQKGTRTS